MSIKITVEAPDLPQLTERMRTEANTLDRLAAIARRETRQSHEECIASVIEHAYREGRWVRINYQGEDDSRAHWRIVKPVSHVRSGSCGGRYVLAVDGAVDSAGGALRCFRTDRIKSASIA